MMRNLDELLDKKERLEYYLREVEMDHRIREITSSKLDVVNKMIEDIMKKGA